MADLGSLVVSLEANIAKFEADLNKAEASSREIMGRIEAVSGTAADALKNVVAAVIAVGSYEALKGAIEAADAMANLAEKTGISTEALSTYQVAAAQSNTSIDAVAQGMKKLGTAMQDHPEYLAQIGVATKDASGNMRSMDAVMQDVAQKFSTYNDGAAKSALAVALFGKSGTELIPMLNEGAAGFQKSAEQAQKYGLVLTTASATAFKETNDKLELINLQNQAFSRNIVAEMLPAISHVSDAFLEFRKNGDQVKTMGDALGFALQSVASIAFGIYGTFTLAGKAIGGWAAVVAEVVHGNFSGAKAAWEAASADIHSQVDTIGSSIQKLWADTSKGAPEAEQKQKKTDAPNVKSTGLQDNIAEYDQLIKSITAKIDIQNQEQAGNIKLSAAEQFEVTVLDSLNHLKIALNATQIQAIKGSLDYLTALSNENAAHQEAQKIIQKSADSSAAAVAQMQFEQSLYGKSADEVARLTAARNIDVKAQQEVNAALANPALQKSAIETANAAAAILLQAEATKKLADQLINLENMKKAAAQFDSVAIENERAQFAQKQLKAYADATAGYKTYAADSEALEMQHQKNLTAIANSGVQSRAAFEQLNMTSQIGLVSGILMSATSQAAQHNKEMFEINKAASIANAIVSTYEGANKALSLGPWGIPIAGVIIAAGMANVASIASTSFGSSASGGGGGSTAGVSTTPTAASVAPVPATTAAIAPKPRLANIVIDPNAYGNLAQFVRTQLIPALNTAQADGYTLNGATV